MKFIPKVPSIAKEGLKPYLERTKEEHNGYGYEEFVKRIELGEPKTVMAKAFSVSKQTMYKWLEVHEQERARV